jgi:hypothetical protein
LKKITAKTETILFNQWLTSDEIENAIRPDQSHDRDTGNGCSRKERLPTAE